MSQTTPQTTEYLAHFGLSRAPFSQGENDLYYASSLLTQRLDLLSHLAQFTQRLLVIKGDHGSGKSALLQQFLRRAEENWQLCSITAEIALDETALWREINHCYGLREDSTLDQLRERLDDLTRSDNLPIITIDDAHLLPEASLVALLQNLAANKQNENRLATLILSGEAPLETMLDEPALAVHLNEKAQIIDLPAMDEEQVTAYLQHRLTAAGRPGAHPFSATQLKQISQSSAGLPGAINDLAHRLLDKMAQSPERATSSTSKPATEGKSRPLRLYLGATLFVLAIAPLLLFQEQINQFFEPADTEQVAPPVSLPAQPINRPLEEIKPVVRAPIKPVPLPEEKPVEVAPAATVEPTTPAPVERVVAEVTPTERPEVTPAATTDPAVEPVKPTPLPTPVIETEIRGEAWLLSQRPTLYTLQLLGSEQEQAIIDYIRNNQIKANAAYFQTTNKGKIWFALLYGIYPSYEAARSAKNQLPPSLNRYTPWPRSIASVHSDINRAKRH